MSATVSVTEPHPLMASNGSKKMRIQSRLFTKVTLKKFVRKNSIFTKLINLRNGNLENFALPAQSSLQEPALFSVCCGYGDVTMNPDPVPGYRKNCVGPLAFSVAEPCHFCSAPVVTSKNSVLIIHSIIFTPP